MTPEQLLLTIFISLVVAVASIVIIGETVAFLCRLERRRRAAQVRADLDRSTGGTTERGAL